jgi:hypothetical protein
MFARQQLDPTLQLSRLNKWPNIKKIIKEEYLFNKKNLFLGQKQWFFKYSCNAPAPFSRFFAFTIVQNGLADFSWPGTAGAGE